MEENQNPEVLPEELAPEEPETVVVADVQFRPGQKVYFFDPAGAVYAAGDHVVMDTARGEEFGTITAGNHSIRRKDVVAPLRKILRMATERDERINAENRAREKRAFEVCSQKVEQHGLDMQTVSAECAFDGSKILFYFTADERVDFRELVKDLAAVFHTRIELRQIGVRDKARMVGGLGICGRPFCCASFLADFQPVSIKMAKTQNLSLNPTKISGTCGRLMCCLKYEQDTYEDLMRSSPKVDSFVDTPEGRGTVIDSEILRQRVRVRMENDPDTVAVFANEDIAVLRSGRARKNDPPIPADLAPISGDGVRPRKKQEQAESPALEPIRFRYSTEKIVDEPEAQDAPEAAGEAVPVAAAAAEQPRQPRENRRRREDRPRKPAAAQQPREDAPAEKPGQEAGAGKPANAERSERSGSRRNHPPRKPRPEQNGQPAAEGGTGESRPREAQAEGDALPRRDGRNRHRSRRPEEKAARGEQGGSAEAGQPRKPREEQPGSAENRPNHRRRRPRGHRPGGTEGTPAPQE